MGGRGLGSLGREYARLVLSLLWPLPSSGPPSGCCCIRAALLVIASAIGLDIGLGIVLGIALLGLELISEGWVGCAAGCGATLTDRGWGSLSVPCWGGCGGARAGMLFAATAPGLWITSAAAVRGSKAMPVRVGVGA